MRGTRRPNRVRIGVLRTPGHTHTRQHTCQTHTDTTTSIFSMDHVILPAVKKTRSEPDRPPKRKVSLQNSIRPESNVGIVSGVGVALFSTTVSSDILIDV